MDLTVGEAVQLSNAMTSLLAFNAQLGRDGGYAVLLNLRRLEPVVAAADEARLRLVEQFGQRDGAGELVQEGGQYVFTDRAGFEAGFAELMARVESVDLRLIPVADLPKALDLQLLERLFPVLVETAAT